jgi:hypothetical protein
MTADSRDRRAYLVRCFDFLVGGPTLRWQTEYASAEDAISAAKEGICDGVVAICVFGDHQTRRSHEVIELFARGHVPAVSAARWFED